MKQPQRQTAAAGYASPLMVVHDDRKRIQLSHSRSEPYIFSVIIFSGRLTPLLKTNTKFNAQKRNHFFVAFFPSTIKCMCCFYLHYVAAVRARKSKEQWESKMHHNRKSKLWCFLFRRVSIAAQVSVPMYQDICCLVYMYMYLIVESQQRTFYIRSYKGTPSRIQKRRNDLHAINDALL